jgi:hypothetical protein
VGGGLQAGIQITIATGGVTDDKIDTVAARKLVAGTITVGDGGMSFTGNGGITVLGGGAVTCLINGMMASFFKGNSVGGSAFMVGNTTVIGADCVANFASVSIQGYTKIDSAANFFTNACHVYGLLDFNGGTSSSATAGGAGPLPSLPDGYINMQVGGANKRIPYYAV